MHTPWLTKTMLLHDPFHLKLSPRAGRYCYLGYTACIVSAVDLIAVIVDGRVSGHGMRSTQSLYLPL